MTIVEITQTDVYSPGQRLAARSRLNKSPVFLLLGLGSELGSERNPLPSTRCICSLPGAQLKVLTLVSRSKSWTRSANARICIELTARQSPKARKVAANKILSGIEGLFAQVHHTTYEDFGLYRIPRQLINGSEVSIENVERLDAMTAEIPSKGAIERKLGSFIVIPDAALACIFYLLPLVLSNVDLFNACSFFRSCCADYNFMDGVVTDVLHEPKRGPENERERLALENVILQSFRTVEAIVGEPGKDERRFHSRMRAVDLDPSELVGFPGRRKKRLDDRIRWLQAARDSATAHGKRRRPTPFTMFEGMEAQHIADSVLHRALWLMAETHGRSGSGEEIGFLLAEMFQDLEDPNWTNDPTLFGGRSAVELAQSPNGLRTILQHRERQSKLRT